MSDKLKIPSVLAFEKKLVPSDARLSAVTWADREQQIPVDIKLEEKAVRGTISNRLSTKLEKDPAKIDREVEKANLQTVDHCALPGDQDTLKLRFTLKTLNNIEEPSACNDVRFRQSYKASVRSYIDQVSFKELAHRYATNLANARFLWRNRVGAQQIEVIVVHLNDKENQQWSFGSKEIGLHDFDNPAVNQLADVIASSLSGETEFALFDVTAFSQLGQGQEVYPSQELITENKDKSKVLYEVDGVAALHSQKIGNAIRTIDTWYTEEPERPIAVEAYGAVTNMGTAFRKPTEKNDFYTLFDKFATGSSEQLNLEEQHFVMAMLVRGGVFGQSAK